MAKTGVVAYIPARLGSERVKAKNLRLLGGQPLVSHVVKAALRSQRLDRLFLNSESDAIIGAVADLGIEIYRRHPDLARAATSTDEILYDFAKSIPAGAVAVINPTAPFLSSATIDRVVESYLRDPEATWFTTTRQRRHLVYDGVPINFTYDGRSPRTQDLSPFEIINFVVFCISHAKIVSNYERNGYCMYKPPLKFIAMSGIECHDIDEEDDFLVAEALLGTRRC
jgi:CMP-N,N'-diacetyllegionaminic acid synthase